MLAFDLDGHHVQDCSSKISSQLYHPCPSKKFRLETPSRGHCGRENRLAVVRPWLDTNHPNSNSPFSVFSASVQTLENPPMLFGHGLAVKAKTLGYVQLSSYQSHAAINEGTLGHILRVCDPNKPLGFIYRIFCFPYRAHSRMSESRPYQGGGARRNAPPQKIPHVQSRFRR